MVCVYGKGCSSVGTMMNRTGVKSSTGGLTNKNKDTIFEWLLRHNVAIKFVNYWKWYEYSSGCHEEYTNHMYIYTDFLLIKIESSKRSRCAFKCKVVY